MLHVDDLIGKTENEAVRIIKKAGLVPFVTQRDSQKFNINRIATPNRVRLFIMNGKVVRAVSG